MSTPESRWSEVRRLFEDLVDRTPEERASALASITDADIRADVERLLTADAAAGSFLDTPAAVLAGDLIEDLEARSPGAIPEAPERIGPYTVVGLLGRGGMGDVFLAERSDGVFSRRVAIKLLRRGMDSEEVLARFHRERRILARLEHPHIARILDGGVSSDGRPYFVMDLVEGLPITKHCKAASATVEERLRLVLDCCDAVSAAHRSLVVHRDLKPSNVLVTGGGEVKLLDFGIAKLLGPDEADASTAQTRSELRMLTPAYAAPEQVLGEPVTTATDVWALGALLYELLTGTLPFRRDGLAPAALAASVNEEKAERPSARVAAAPPDTLPVESATERVRHRWARRLQGDLDNIVAVALRRNADRRYPSAAALAEDLRRHLDGRPVQARPESFGYRLGKFVRRQRAAVAAAAIVLLSLCAGLAGTTWQARRARQNAGTAAAAARRAEAVKEFLIGLFEVADPDQASGGSITARELLDQAGRRLQTELKQEPDVQADLLEAVARIDRGLGRLDPAESLAAQSLSIRRRLFSPGDAAIGRSLATLGAVQIGKGALDQAEKGLADALRILETKEGPNSLATARARSDLAQVYFWKGDATRSEKMERQVYQTYRRALGDDNVETAIHLRNVGTLLDELDQLDAAEAAFRSSQAVLERRLGPEHPNLGQSYLSLAELDERRGRFQDAEHLYRRSLEVRKRALGATHPVVGQTLQLSALFFLNQGRLAESEERYREALAIFRGIDPKHFEVGKCLNGLALIASRRGRYAEAEKILLDVDRLFTEVLGEKHPFTWQARNNRAAQISLQGRHAEAEAIMRPALARIIEITGEESGETADARTALGETLRKLKRYDEAVTLHRRAMAVQTKILGESAPGVALLRFQLAADLAEGAREQDRAEARRLFDQSLGVYRKISPPPPRLPEVLLASGNLARLEGNPERARRELAESAALTAQHGRDGR